MTMIVQNNLESQVDIKITQYDDENYVLKEYVKLEPNETKEFELSNVEHNVYYFTTPDNTSDTEINVHVTIEKQ